MSYTILIVDDEPNILISLEFLMKQKGYDVVIAQNGQEALAALSEKLPDLILLDVMMPKPDGYEVCQKIKSDPETCNTKIMVLSAYLDDEKFKKMIEYGADICFSKPLPLSQLKLEVSKLLNPSEA